MIKEQTYEFYVNDNSHVMWRRLYRCTPEVAKRLLQVISKVHTGVEWRTIEAPFITDEDILKIELANAAIVEADNKIKELQLSGKDFGDKILELIDEKSANRIYICGRYKLQLD